MLVLDDQGDATMRVPTPQPASGLCFGGAGFSELLITSSSTVWRVPTSTQVRMPAHARWHPLWMHVQRLRGLPAVLAPSQGVQPPSAEFLKMMDIATTGFRHEGW